MDGILVINKPKGMTSHDVVDVVRRRFGIKRVGHAGTLDPMATGVLVILLGKATKLSSTFLNKDKEYVATIYLGQKTDTQDSTGKIIEEKRPGRIDIQDIRKAFDSFCGEIEQTPPMISAKKHKGKKLYKLARKGKVVPRKPCKVNIHDIELLNFNLPHILFRVRCSKGTYIRTLCEDIGSVLGYPAHMSSLVRTRSGSFSIKDSSSLEALSEKDIRSI